MAAGDHLVVARKIFIFPYYHHGIDVGDGRVIHLTGTRKKDAKVIETSLAEFLKEGEKEVIEYVRFTDLIMNNKRYMQSAYGRDHWMTPFLDDDRIDEIKRRIEDPQRTVTAHKYLNRAGYNLFADNCEHFAVFCKTGLYMSLISIEYQKVWDQIFDDMHKSPLGGDIPIGLRRW